MKVVLCFVSLSLVTVTAWANSDKKLCTNIVASRDFSLEALRKRSEQGAKNFKKQARAEERERKRAEKAEQAALNRARLKEQGTVAKKLIDALKSRIEEVAETGGREVEIGLNYLLDVKERSVSMTDLFKGQFGYEHPHETSRPGGELRYVGRHKAVGALVDFCKKNKLDLKFEGTESYYDDGSPYGDSEYPAYEKIVFQGYMVTAKVSW